jgi:hypothetical protein
MDYLVTIGISFLRDKLVPKLGINPLFKSLVEKILYMIGELTKVFTDNNKDNARQLRDLWQVNYIELLALVLDGAVQAIRGGVLKQKVVAILRTTLDKIESDDTI